MRLLPSEKREAIIKSVKNNLAKTKFQIKMVKTISGQREAFYDWLAINYRLHTLQKHQATYVTLDLGGASTQLTYASASRDHTEKAIMIELAGITYQVKTQSYLGLGLSEALKKLGHPRECFPKQYPTPDGKSGLFDFHACQGKIDNYLKQFTIKTLPTSILKNCCFVFSSFYHVLHFFKADSPEQLQNAVKQRCSYLTWQQIKKENPTISPKYLARACFSGTYISTLLTSKNAYQLPPSVKLYTLTPARMEHLSWTLGTALFNTTEQNN